MSQKESTPADPQTPPLDLEKQSAQSMKALGTFGEKIKPWLFAFGNWIFGGLIAFNLIVVGALITAGPARTVILISIAAFACALPLDLTGLFLLKLVQDMNELAIDDLMREAFKDADFPDIEAYIPQGSSQKRRTDVVLRSAIGIATVSIVLTTIGMVAALWYMAWWIGVIFVAMVIVSLVLVFSTLAHSVPPESDAEKALKRRYMEQRNQQKQMERKPQQHR